MIRRIIVRDFTLNPDRFTSLYLPLYAEGSSLMHAHKKALPRQGFRSIRHAIAPGGDGHPPRRVPVPEARLTQVPNR
jgi:hypothetical protein